MVNIGRHLKSSDIRENWVYQVCLLYWPKYERVCNIHNWIIKLFRQLTQVIAVLNEVLTMFDFFALGAFNCLVYRFHSVEVTFCSNCEANTLRRRRRPVIQSRIWPKCVRKVCLKRVPLGKVTIDVFEKSFRDWSVGRSCFIFAKSQIFWRKKSLRQKLNYELLRNKIN